MGKIPVMFYSEGIPLFGTIFRNCQDATLPQPAVIVTGSWLTVKEQMPYTYAEKLADKGYTVLTFDFSGFGASGGEARQAEIPQRKIKDIVAAAEFLSTLSFVKANSIGQLAICASAQYALAAIAGGAPLQSFVSVAGWYHDMASVSPFYGGVAGVEKRLGLAAEAVTNIAAGRPVLFAPAYKPGDEEAGMSFELDYYQNPMRGAIAEWKNEMNPMTWFYWLTFDGMKAAPQVRIPALFIHGDQCVLPDNVRKVYERIPGEKELIWTDGDQISFYDRNDLVEMAVCEADKHFKRSL